MLELEIEGSSGNSYVARFVRDGDRLTTVCTCPAGEMRTHCKHRLAVLGGDFRQVRGTVPPDLAQRIDALLLGTELERVMQALVEAEAAVAAAQAVVKRHKKALDRVMHE
jgi:uncharacterized Zn finger protein